MLISSFAYSLSNQAREVKSLAGYSESGDPLYLLVTVYIGILLGIFSQPELFLVNKNPRQGVPSS